MQPVVGMDAALNGLRVALESFERTARTLAATAPLGDLPGNMVQLMQDRHAVRANVAVIRTADEMIGTLLDVLA